MTASFSCIAHDLRERLVDAVVTPFVASFHGSNGPSIVVNDNDARKSVRAFRASLLRSSSSSMEEAEKAGFDDSRYADLLRAALNEPHDTKDAFNAALFDAMAACILGCTASSPASPWANVHVSSTGIVLEWKSVGAVRGFEYATGLALKATIRVEKGCSIYERFDEEDEDDDDNSNDDDDADADNDSSGTRLPNSHLLVVYRRPKVEAGVPAEGWTVWKVLAVVDLKRGINVGAPTRDGEEGNVDRRSVFLHDLNYPIAPAIMYTLAYAVPGIAALGGERPPASRPYIPFAVFSCKTDARPRVRTGWVHGNLVTPEECGHRFSFNVDAYGPLYHRKIRKRWNDSNVAAYLHVMTYGVDAASRWLERLARQPPDDPKSTLPAPNPMSGRELQFRLRYYAKKDVGRHTTVPNAVLVATPALAGIDPHFHMTKGELFRATVNLNSLMSSLGSEHRMYWCLDAYPDAPTTVLFKVSSRSCFNILVPNHSRYLFGCIEHMDYWELRKDVREVLSPSLYGLYMTTDSIGLVHFLPDLHGLGYRPIPVGSRLDAPGRSQLWKAFAALVRDVLIPLARRNVVHCDIRVGSRNSPSASNLLYNPDLGSMRLVDLDCLCHFERLRDVPHVFDPAFLSGPYLPDPLRSATGFVLAQIVCAAEAWRDPALCEGDRKATFRANDVVDRALQRRRSASHPPSSHHPGPIFDDDAFDESGTFVAIVDEALIETVLDRYEAELDLRARRNVSR